MKEFMQKFDKNKDGRIEMSEVSCLIYFPKEILIFKYTVFACMTGVNGEQSQ